MPITIFSLDVRTQSPSTMTLASLLVLLAATASSASACDIMGATGCPKIPESALKADDFLSFCEQYKAHLACVFDSYSGCERKDKYAHAMPSLTRGLHNKIRKTEKLCDMDFEIPLPALNEDGSLNTNATVASTSTFVIYLFIY